MVRRILVWALVVGVVVAVGVIAGIGLRHGSGGTTAPGSRPAKRTERQPALVDHARWQTTSQGYRLIVTPTGYGRLHARGRPGRALDQAMADARPTPLHIGATVRRSLRDQLLCHADFAVLKPTWNLETWRPDVGLARTIAALCNP